MEKRLAHKEDLPQIAREGDFDVLVVLGAGDADNYCPEITEILNSKL